MRWRRHRRTTRAPFAADPRGWARPARSCRHHGMQTGAQALAADAVAALDNSNIISDIITDIYADLLEPAVQSRSSIFFQVRSATTVAVDHRLPDQSGGGATRPRGPFLFTVAYQAVSWVGASLTYPQLLIQPLLADHPLRDNRPGPHSSSGTRPRCRQRAVPAATGTGTGAGAVTSDSPEGRSAVLAGRRASSPPRWRDPGVASPNTGTRSRHGRTRARAPVAAGAEGPRLRWASGDPGDGFRDRTLHRGHRVPRRPPPTSWASAALGRRRWPPPRDRARSPSAPRGPRSRTVVTATNTWTLEGDDP